MKTSDRLKIRITLDLEVPDEATAEEFGWVLNLVRDEITKNPQWEGKVRHIKFVSSEGSS